MHKLYPKTIIIIGGGASGFFAAINASEKYPDAKITILEKSNKLLSKVRISGGGRCNVTHHCFEHAELVKNYPRGHKELRQVFSRFSVEDTIHWFEKRNVNLKTESDGRMFPVSNSSESIIQCFMHEAQRKNIEIKLQEEVLELNLLETKQIKIKTISTHYLADAVICSIGGHHQLKNYQFLKQIGHTIDQLIPSLFTINLPDSNIKEFMGLSMKQVTVKVSGTKHQYTGPLLITHWGLSGPAVLKLSAFAAIDFYQMNYDAQIIINWLDKMNEETCQQHLSQQNQSKALVINTPLFEIPKRLWEYFIQKAEIQNNKPWSELSKKQLHKLAQLLTSDIYHMQGKTTFKDEFVTCGGINLKEVDFKTMQSKIMPGLYFCGEVLNIDGITGGFNFQNAWSTAWIASQLNS